jgi:3-dehydroquinate synthetase
LDDQAIIAAIRNDKKSMAGRVQWVMLERIGRARIVSDVDIKPKLLRASLRAILRQQNRGTYF